jgi:lysophospholipase L1-like esterase
MQIILRISMDAKPASARTKQSRFFKVWLPLLAVVLAVAIYGIWEFWYRQPVGTGPAGPSVAASAFQETWTTRPALLIGLGDSITAGLGARKGYSYFDRLLHNPADEWPDMAGIHLRPVIPNLQSTNLALSGSTSLDHQRRQLPRLPVVDSNTLAIVVFTTGGNDLIHDYGRSEPREGAMFGATWEQAQPWITNFAARLEQMLDEIKARFPGGCEIFLADIYDPTDGTGDARRVGLPLWPDGLRIHSAYNQIIHSAATRRENVHLVKLHEPFLGHGLCCRRVWNEHYRPDDPHYWFWVNLEDPNERGYDAIRRLFLLALSEAKHRFQ